MTAPEPQIRELKFMTNGPPGPIIVVEVEMWATDPAGISLKVLDGWKRVTDSDGELHDEIREHAEMERCGRGWSIFFYFFIEPEVMPNVLSRVTLTAYGDCITKRTALLGWYGSGLD